MLKALNGDLDGTRKWSRHKSYDMLIVYNDDITHEKTLETFHETFNRLSKGGDDVKS